MNTTPFVVTRGVPPVWPGISSAAWTVVRFLATARQSGDADEAAAVMAPHVLAHQVSSWSAQTIVRTPEEYAEHVCEQLRVYGPFSFEVTEFLEQGDRVFVRWIQRGHHVRDYDGSPGTGEPLSDVGSAVYRVERGRIAEYWIQLDTHGFLRQVEAFGLAS